MNIDLDKNTARRHFSRAARSYDRWSQPQQVMADCLMAMISDVPPPQSILEIGCGTGVLTERLVQTHPDARILAVDIAEGMVATCRAKFSNASNTDFLVADAETMLIDAFFDLIVSNSCLQWMCDLPKTLRNLAGLLNDDGVLALSSPVQGTLRELWASYAAVTDGSAAGHTMPTSHDYHNAMAQTGLHDVCIEQQEHVFRYSCAEEAVRSVRELGATRATRKFRPLSRHQLKRMMDYYGEAFPSTDGDGGVTCTYNVIYATARR